jgi:hypothetical protein
MVGLTRIYDPSFIDWKDILVMMSRCWLFTIARSGGTSRRISGTLGKEGWEECYGYFEVSTW